MNTIAAQTGIGFKIKKGEYLKVVCPEGEQVADLVAYRTDDMTECISNGKTFDYEETIFLTTGNILYSNKSQEMLEIVLDTCGRHDFLLAPCCPDTFKKLYDNVAEHPSCRNNLYENLKKYGIEAHTIPTAFNIFMKVDVNKEGKLKLKRPQAKAGDGLFHYFITSFFPELLKLTVQIERDGRHEVPSGPSAGQRVKADQKKGLAPKAIRKIRIIGIFAYLRIPVEISFL